MSAIMILQIALVVLLIFFLFLLFSRIGKACCASKLGLKCGWMAFMPFLNAYLDGRMAEASDNFTDPNRKRKRKWGRLNLLLRVLSVISIGLFAISLILFFVTLVLAFFADIMHIKMGSIIDMIKLGVKFFTNIVSYIRDKSFLDTIKEYKLTSIASLTVMVISVIVFIVSAVVEYLVLYKTYYVFSPRKAGLYLVLSFLIVPSITVIFMVLGCAWKYERPGTGLEEAEDDPLIPAGSVLTAQAPPTAFEPADEAGACAPEIGSGSVQDKEGAPEISFEPLD